MNNTTSLIVVGVIVAAASWYWSSPWPVALGAAFIALSALDLARTAVQHSAVLWRMTQPARPMRMYWTFSILLTERAWDAMGVPSEHRATLQEQFGNYPGRYTDYLFKGHPRPNWISRPIGVTYERWGESLERWTVFDSWISDSLGEPAKHHEKRVLEYLPEMYVSDLLIFSGEHGEPQFRYEDGRLIFLQNDKRATGLPDGSLYITDPSCVLFDIPAPTLSMKRGDWRTKEPNPLERFAAPPDPSSDWPGYNYYGRQPGDEHFECEDWSRGFRWELKVHDLRPYLDARVVRIHRTLWHRRVTLVTVELESGGLRISASPELVESSSHGNSLPKKGESVRVVLNDEGIIDRIWLTSRD